MPDSWKNNLDQAETILVRAPNWVGDVVMATPLFAALREGFPHTRLVACVRPYVTKILADNPWFDEILAVNDKGSGGFRKSVKAIRDAQPGAAILLPNSWRTLLATRMARVPLIFGYRRRRRRLLLTDGPLPERDADGQVVPKPMVDYYLEIGRFLGLSIPDNPRPELFAGDAVTTAGDKLLAQYGIEPDDVVIGINPGAKFGSSKCWPTEHFARLAELLAQDSGRKQLLLVGPGEDEIAAAICEQTAATLINTAPDKVDLELLKPLIRRCQVLVTNDTGPRHYGVALGVPTVVLMGPTDPRYTASNLDNTIVLRQDLPCAPCHLKICPDDHACMTGIEPEQAAEAVETLLKGALS